MEVIADLPPAVPEAAEEVLAEAALSEAVWAAAGAGPDGVPLVEPEVEAEDPSAEAEALVAPAAASAGVEAVSVAAAVAAASADADNNKKEITARKSRDFCLSD